VSPYRTRIPRPYVIKVTKHQLAYIDDDARNRFRWCITFGITFGIMSLSGLISPINWVVIAAYLGTLIICVTGACACFTRREVTVTKKITR
jgi:hypothetical protein